MTTQERLEEENAKLRELLLRCLSKIRPIDAKTNPIYSASYLKILDELHRDIEAALER